MNYIDLFHGIGGFAVGAYWAGMKFENHYCSDIEPYLVELYKKRFPDSIQLGDIREINCEKLMADTDNRRKKSSVQTRGNESEKSGRTDWIITGGFPCQDISVAGKGTGIRGSRSGLWFEMWRIIRDLRPRFAIMENVGALTFRGLTDVLGSLAEIGYDAEWQDIRAEDMGAPHRRERIWIVAYPGSRSGGKGGIQRCSENIKETRKGTSGNVIGTSQDVAYPSIERERGLYIRSGKSRQTEIIIDGNGKEISNSFSINDDNGRHGTSEICRQRSEKADLSRSGNWIIEPDVGMLVDGLSSDMDRFEGRLANKSYKRIDQLKGLGNSIVPQIAELLFRQIKEQI